MRAVHFILLIVSIQTAYAQNDVVKHLEILQKKYGAKRAVEYDVHYTFVYENEEGEQEIIDTNRGVFTQKRKTRMLNLNEQQHITATDYSLLVDHEKREITYMPAVNLKGSGKVYMPTITDLLSICDSVYVEEGESNNKVLTLLSTSTKYEKLVFYFSAEDHVINQVETYFHPINGNKIVQVAKFFNTRKPTIKHKEMGEKTFLLISNECVTPQSQYSEYLINGSSVGIPVHSKKEKLKSGAQ